jgi:RimJ/RimL family protein N-acetyltransferase
MSSFERFPLRRDVHLMPLESTCAERMFNWMTDPEVAANIGLRAEPSLQKTREWIVKAAQDPCVRPFAVYVKHTHVGNVVLDQIDTYLSKARLSIYIGEPSARGGYTGAMATFLTLKFAFEELRMYKVWATVHARNGRAIKNCLRFGFQVEGVLRGEFLLGGRRVASLYMSTLADEFAELTANW